MLLTHALRLIAFVFAVGAIAAGTTAHFAGAIYVNVRRQIDQIAADECDNMRRMADEISEFDPEARRDPMPEMCAKLPKQGGEDDNDRRDPRDAAEEWTPGDRC